MPTVKNLKMLKGVLYADVQVAGLDNGGWVEMKVKVARGDDAAVSEALDQLNQALAALASRNLGQVAANRFIEKKVRDATTVERRRHREALEVQRTTMRSDFARRLLRLRDRISDAEVRALLNRALNEFEQAS